MRSYVSTGSSQVREDEKAVLSAYVSKVLKSTYETKVEADMEVSDEKIAKISDSIVEKSVEFANKAQWRDENDFSCDLVDESSDQDKRRQQVPLQMLVGNYNVNTSVAARHCALVLIHVIGNKVAGAGLESIIPKTPAEIGSYINDIIVSNTAINQYTKAVVSLTDEEVIVARAGAYLTTGNSLGIGLGIDNLRSFTFDQLVFAVKNGLWKTKALKGGSGKIVSCAELTVDAISSAVGSADDYTLACAAESLLASDATQESISNIFNKLLKLKVFKRDEDNRYIYAILSMNSKSISPNALSIGEDESNGV